MKGMRISAAATVAAALATAAAADWPEQPVKVVVPWAAGGLADSVGRAFQTAIEEHDLLAQPMAIVNVGGHFSIGMRRVKDAGPGDEFLLGNVAIMAGEGSGVMDFGFRDLEPVAETGESCFVPTVRADSGVESLDALMARAQGDEPLVVGVNIGANNHVAAAMLADAVEGADFRYTQTGGDTDSYTALKGDQIDLAFLSAAAVSKFAMDEQGAIDSSEVRPLAYMGEERHPAMPDMPTATEAGHQAVFCIPMWWFAPAGTSEEAVAGLADALERASETERVQIFYEERMMAPTFRRGDALDQRLAAIWKDIEPKAEQVAKAKKE